MEEKDGKQTRLCMSCLCMDRTVNKINNDPLKKFYIDALREIPVRIKKKHFYLYSIFDDIPCIKNMLFFYSYMIIFARSRLYVGTVKLFWKNAFRFGSKLRTLIEFYWHTQMRYDFYHFTLSSKSFYLYLCILKSLILCNEWRSGIPLSVEKNAANITA